MTKRILLVAAASLGLMLAPGAAHADTIFNFNIGPPNVQAGAAGFWHVQAKRIGGSSSTNWEVRIKGGPTDYAGNVLAQPDSPSPAAEKFGRRVSLLWQCCPQEGRQDLVAPTPTATLIGAGAGAWSNSPAGNGHEHSHLAESGGGAGLAFDGSNELVITNINLAKLASRMTIDITNGSTAQGNAQWTGAVDFDVSCVPEPASMTLAMAGLAPAGLALLKRRRRSSVEETEETEEA